MNHLQCSYRWGRRIYYFVTGLASATVISGLLIITHSQPLISATMASLKQLYAIPSIEQPLFIMSLLQAETTPPRYQNHPGA